MLILMLILILIIIIIIIIILILIIIIIITIYYNSTKRNINSILFRIIFMPVNLISNSIKRLISIKLVIILLTVIGHHIQLHFFDQFRLEQYECVQYAYMINPEWYFITAVHY